MAASSSYNETSVGGDGFDGFLDSFQLALLAEIASPPGDLLLNHPPLPTTSPPQTSTHSIPPLSAPLYPQSSTPFAPSSWEEGEWDASCPFVLESSKAGKPKRNRKNEPTPDAKLVLVGSLEEGRAQKACSACRARKSRCDGGLSCTRCDSSGTQCVYPIKTRLPQPIRKRRKPASSSPLPPCFTTKVLEHRPAPTTSEATILDSRPEANCSPRRSSVGREGGESRQFEREIAEGRGEGGNLGGAVASGRDLRVKESSRGVEEKSRRQPPLDLYRKEPRFLTIPFSSALSPPLSDDNPHQSYGPSCEYFGNSYEQGFHQPPLHHGLPSPLLSQHDASPLFERNGIPSHPSSDCNFYPHSYQQAPSIGGYPFPPTWESPSFFHFLPQVEQESPMSSSSSFLNFGERPQITPVQRVWGEGSWVDTDLAIPYSFGLRSSEGGAPGGALGSGFIAGKGEWNRTDISSHHHLLLPLPPSLLAAMFNPHPGAGLVTITYHYYPSSSNPPSSWPTAPFTAPPVSAPPLPSLPKGEKPNVDFFQYLATLARSYQTRRNLFSSSTKEPTLERKELESTFLTAVQSILFTSPSLIGNDPTTREIVLQTLFLCKKIGLDPELCRKAGYQVLEEWYGELEKAGKALEKRRIEGLKEKREELSKMRSWTSSYQGAGWSGDPYARKEKEMVQGILKEERELAKEESAWNEERERRYERVQREFPLD
ncbi:hypothetical protein BDY24DRAFT_412496 [Mrakia frigida]|uniref:uncharacterized protein n=1 Tax=Mrakia frigida TaxID=29902 RepID=UPI003FCC1EEB